MSGPNVPARIATLRALITEAQAELDALEQEQTPVTVLLCGYQDVTESLAVCGEQALYQVTPYASRDATPREFACPAHLNDTVALYHEACDQHGWKVTVFFLPVCQICVRPVEGLNDETEEGLVCPPCRPIYRRQYPPRA